MSVRVVALPPIDETADLIKEMVTVHLPLGNGVSAALRYSEVWVGDELVRQVEVWEPLASEGHPPRYQRRAAVLR